MACSVKMTEDSFKRKKFSRKEKSLLCKHIYLYYFLIFYLLIGSIRQKETVFFVCNFFMSEKIYYYHVAYPPFTRTVSFLESTLLMHMQKDCDKNIAWKNYI